MIDLQIKQGLKKSDMAGKMMKWSVELSEFDMRYKPQGPIKSQVLDDFIV